MNFLKPKFWDETKISIFSVLLFPITLILIFLSFLKRTTTKTYQYSVPVICVGNIYLGGTGKTPLCIEIFSILKNLNMRPAFIRKKYDAFKDEAYLQKQIGPVYQNKKRTEALKEAIENKANIAILDDGYQDFSIKKKFSIVCFNEKQWIGNGFRIPSGPLRESLSSLIRADCVIIYGKKNDNIESKILEINKSLKIFYAKYNAENINSFKDKKVICFAGIGNPINFFDLLKNNKINVIDEISFPDHHNYSRKELEDLVIKSKKNNAILLTTEKDYLRINENCRENIKFLKIKTALINQDKFINEIKKII
tara:strand:- start:2043 stop:2972 length:930 start_codon:yes stop_codon:yes gene_type:complete